MELSDFLGKDWVYIENDCWSVVRKVAQSVYNKEYPMFDLPAISTPEVNQALFLQNSFLEQWRETDGKPGDVVLFFDRRELPFHCGICVDNGRSVLHCYGTPKKPGKTVIEQLRKMNKFIYKSHKIYAYHGN